MTAHDVALITIGSNLGALLTLLTLMAVDLWHNRRAAARR